MFSQGYNDEAVQAVLEGKDLNEIDTQQVLISDREVMERKINLLRVAIARKEQEVQEMQPKIWLESLPQYEVFFRELFKELIETSEPFLNCLHRLQVLQGRIRNETGIPEIAWPAEWRLDQEWYRRIGINPDGKGLFLNLIAQLKKNWNGQPRFFK